MSDAERIGAGSPSESQRRDSSRQDRISPAPQPEETAALKSAEPVNPVPRFVPADSGSLLPARSESREPAPESHAAPAAEVPAIEPRPSQPVHDVTLSLTSDTQRVDVKLVDRGGELHVEVQSADPVLTSDLRASVRDLIGGLEKSGFHAEAWPAGDAPRHNSEPHASASRGAGDQPQSQSGDDPRRQGRNAYNPDYAPPRRNRGSNTDWIKEMSALTSAEKENEWQLQ